MVTSCCVPGCKNRFKMGKNISFHVFPKDPDLRKRWLKLINRIDFHPTKTTKLCSEHFLEGDFVQNFGKRSLVSDAVPSVFKFSCNSPPKAMRNRKTWKKDMISTIPFIDCNKLEDLNEKPTSMLSTIPLIDCIKLEHRTEKPTSMPSSISSIECKQLEGLIENPTSMTATIPFIDCNKLEDLIEKPTFMPFTIPSIECKKLEDLIERPTSMLSPVPVIECNKFENLIEKPTSMPSTIPIIECKKLEDLIEKPTSTTSMTTTSVVASINTDEPMQNGECIMKRRRSVPVYFGDFKLSDMQNPTKAAEMWEIANSTIEKQKKNIKYLRNKNYRLMNRIKIFEDRNHSKDTKHICNNCSSTSQMHS